MIFRHDITESLLPDFALSSERAGRIMDVQKWDRETSDKLNRYPALRLSPVTLLFSIRGISKLERAGRSSHYRS